MSSQPPERGGSLYVPGIVYSPFTTSLIRQGRALGLMDLAPGPAGGWRYWLIGWPPPRLFHHQGRRGKMQKVKIPAVPFLPHQLSVSSNTLPFLNVLCTLLSSGGMRPPNSSLGSIPLSSYFSHAPTSLALQQFPTIRCYLPSRLGG